MKKISGGELSLDEIRRQCQTVIVTALPKEFAAMASMLKDCVPLSIPEDPNDYIVGNVLIQKSTQVHRVVVAMLKKLGTQMASAATAHVTRSFPEARNILMVGIAYGCPCPKEASKHVRLGDVVVSDQHGVIQVDHVKITDGRVEYRGIPLVPGSELLGRVNYLEFLRIAKKYPWERHISKATGLENAERPDDSEDQLISSDPAKSPVDHPVDPSRRPGKPRIHHGAIASANMLLKDAKIRDELAMKFNIRAGEMEGSGLADAAWLSGRGFLIIRGICDYGDNAKKDRWQGYAAAVAAAYARALIEVLPPPGPQRSEPRIQDVTAESETQSLPQKATLAIASYSRQVQNFLEHYLLPADRVAFGGRGKDLQQLDAWLIDHKAPPYLICYGPAGRGKSALLCRWYKTLQGRPDILPIFAPISQRFGTHLASVTLPGLLGAVLRIFGDPQDLPESLDAYGMLIPGYLRQTPPTDKTLVLILDGIDEAVDWQLGPEILPPAPGPRIKIVLSTRADGSGTNEARLRQALGLDAQRAPLRLMPLGPLDLAGITEIANQYSNIVTLPSEDKAAFLSELYRVSNGDPLLTKVYLDGLPRDFGSDDKLDLGWLRRSPPGYLGYFTNWWDDQKKLWEAQRKEPAQLRAMERVAAILACALGPLSLQDLSGLVAAEPMLSRQQLRTAIEALFRFLVGDGDKLGYSFSHPRLTQCFYEEWLNADARQATNRRFVEWGQEVHSELNSGRRAPAAAPSYVLQYLGAHLERQSQEPAPLMALLSDGWRTARMTQEGGFVGFLEDVRRAWKAVDRLNRDLVAAHKPPVNLPDTVFYALCRASCVGTADGLSSELLESLVKAKILTPLQAYDSAKHNSFPESRTRAFIKLLPFFLGAQRARLVQIVFDELPGIDWPGERAHQLATAARYMRSAERTRALAQIRQDVKRCQHDHGKLRTRVRVAEHFSERNVLRLDISAVDACKGQAALISILEPGEERDACIEEALRIVNTIGEPVRQRVALAHVAQYFSPAQLVVIMRRTLERCKELSPLRYATVLEPLLPHLSADQLEEVDRELDIEAGDKANPLEMVDFRVRVQRALRTSGKDRQRWTRQLLSDFVRNCGDFSFRSALGLGQLLADRPRDIERALTALARYQSRRERKNDCEEVLTGLAMALPEPYSRTLLIQAKEESSILQDSSFMMGGLAPLLADIPKEQSEKIFMQAMRDCDELFKFNMVSEVIAYRPDLANKAIKNYLNKSIADTEPQFPTLRMRALQSMCKVIDSSLIQTEIDQLLYFVETTDDPLNKDTLRGLMSLLRDTNHLEGVQRVWRVAQEWDAREEAGGMTYVALALPAEEQVVACQLIWQPLLAMDELVRYRRTSELLRHAPTDWMAYLRQASAKDARLAKLFRLVAKKNIDLKGEVCPFIDSFQDSEIKMNLSLFFASRCSGNNHQELLFGAVESALFLRSLGLVDAPVIFDLADQLEPTVAHLPASVLLAKLQTHLPAVARLQRSAAVETLRLLLPLLRQLGGREFAPKLWEKVEQLRTWWP